MKRVIAFAVIVCSALTVGVLQVAADKPNFSGAWEIDTDNSMGVPKGTSQTMTVVQDKEKVTIQVKIVTPQGERVVDDVFVLDGKETEFTPQGPNGPNGKGKRKAYWLPNDKGIVISDETTVEGPKGAVTSYLTRKWVLSADGVKITVDRYSDTPNGAGQSRQYFKKKV